MVYRFTIIACLKRAEQSAHVARRVVVHHSKYDGVHECNHVLGAVGGDAQQHVGAEHVEEKNKVNEAGNVEHFICGYGYNI
jgi:hypothetical protein